MQTSEKKAKREVPKSGAITVNVKMPHVAQWGHNPYQRLAYSCDFPVKVGDTVALPGTSFAPRGFIGRVVALDAGSYMGHRRAAICRAAEGGL